MIVVWTTAAEQAAAGRASLRQLAQTEDFNLERVFLQPGHHYSRVLRLRGGAPYAIGQKPAAPPKPHVRQPGGNLDPSLLQALGRANTRPIRKQVKHLLFSSNVGQSLLLIALAVAVIPLA